jgi:4-amino-4-deoxy-L-arabinose transferase-like glycosyltransferase
MLKQFFKKNWLIIVILVLASFLRLYRISDYMEFLGDQGRDVTIVRSFLQHFDLMFIGPQTSVGNMYLGPFFYYLIAPALLLANFNPVGPAVFIALLGIATVWLIFYVSSKWFSPKVGYIAAFLYAISPITIKYSNFIWNPNIMPFFALLFVYLFFEAIKQEKYKYFIYAALAFVMVINSHYLGLSLLPLVGIFWIIKLVQYLKTKSKKIKPFITNTIFAILVFILSLIPQVLYDIKHQGQISKALISFFTNRETTVNIKPYKALPKMIPLFDQVNTSLLSGGYQTVGIIISITLAIGVIAYFIKKSDSKKRFNYWIILCWLATGLMSLALYKQHIYDHYFGFLFPVIFMLTGLLIANFKWVGIPIFLLIIYVSIITNQFRWEPPKQLKTTTQIADSIIQKSGNNQFNFALLAKQNYDPPYRYILTQKKANLVDLHEKITDQLFVVCEPFQIDCNPINNPAWSVAAFGWAKIDSQWNINGITIFKLVHTKTN